MFRLLRKTLTVLLTLILLLVITAAAYLFWYSHRPLPAVIDNKPLFQGITYSRELLTTPRPLVIHIMQIDLTAPGISFLVTPRDDVDGYAYAARTASQFLDEFGLQVAINGDYYDPWWEYGPFNYYPHVDDPTNVRGLTVSQGNLVTEGYSPIYDAIYISQDNRVSFSRPNEGLYNVIAGNLIIVRDGLYDSTIKPDPYIEQPHPRTAVALSQDERTLTIVVVDGRQPNYSEGVTLPELANILIEQGGYTALNLDGGGSSTLVVEGEDGKALQLGSAIHTRLPGTERPVANHLGIFALPLDG
jgi:hypothetical protein